MKTGLFCKKFSIREYSLLLTLLISSSLFAQIQVPDGYYDRAEGLSNKELKTALHQIIKVGKRLTYGSGSGKTWSGFEKTDRHPEGHVWDMYSNTKRYFPGNAGVPGGMNIEHSVAKSWWGGTNNDAYKDLYHLNPSDANANSARSNYPLGTNKGGRFNNGVIKVGDNTYSPEHTGLCFEPLDEYKGDFARAYMYMFTCYENFSWTGTAAPTMLNSPETWPMLKPWAQKMLVEWSRMDPPSEKELNRAAEIYKIQENRNPFIDYPELVEHLWGNQVGVPFSTNSTNPVITSPYNNSSITLPETHYTAAITEKIPLKGKNLTQNTTISLSGANAHLFSLSTNTLSAAEMNEGKSISVVFMPETAGSFDVTILISNPDVANSVSATIVGRATDNFMTLPASNISSEGFTANWTSHSLAEGYILNLFKKEISESANVTILDQKMDTKPAGWITGGYTDFNDKMARLGSGGSYGSLTTPELDLSKAGQLTVRAKRYGKDSGATISVKVDGEEIGLITTDADLKDYTIELPESTKESQIEFYSAKDKRTYIDQVTIVTGGTAEVYVPVAGYPVNLDLVNAHTISGLEADTEYAYEVTTIADVPVKTNLSELRTLIGTGVETNPLSTIHGHGNNGVIYLYNLPENTTIQVFDLSGRLYLTKVSYSANQQIRVDSKGIFLVRILANNENRMLKLIVK